VWGRAHQSQQIACKQQRPHTGTALLVINTGHLRPRDYMHADNYDHITAAE